MGPLATMFQKQHSLQVLQVMQRRIQAGIEHNSMDQYVRVDSTDPFGSSQQASAHQSFPWDPDLYLFLQHSRPKWSFSFHTRFGWKKKRKRLIWCAFFHCSKGSDNIHHIHLCVPREGRKKGPIDCYTFFEYRKAYVFLNISHAC